MTEPIQPRSRIGRDIAIGVAILALLFFLVELFLRPPQPARDFVFGDLGPVQPARTNLATRTSSPPAGTPQNAPQTAPPSGGSPINGPAGSTAHTPANRPSDNPTGVANGGTAPAPPPASVVLPTQTNDNNALILANSPAEKAMSNGVAAAMAAPPLVGARQSSPLASAQQSPSPGSQSTTSPAPAPSPTAEPSPAINPPAAGPPVVANAAPTTAATPYTPPPTPEPDTKTPTADLLAATKGDMASSSDDKGATSTAALLGVDASKDSASASSPSAPTPPAPPEAPGDGGLGGMTNGDLASRLAFDPGSGTNVSFVIDQSLSMMNNGKSIRARSELLKTLETMGAAKTFYILFFRSGGYEGMPALGPVPATPENIRAITNWLFNVGHRFGSDPTKGISRALGMVPAPDTVWLLSDGKFSRNAVQAIHEANLPVKAQINTVALYSAEGEVVMREIADDNHGTYRFIAPPP